MDEKCFNHPSINADSLCHYCARPLCSSCLSVGRTHCKNTDDCLLYQSNNTMSISKVSLSKNLSDNELILQKIPVRGWLLFFCITLIIIRPCLIIFGYVLTFSKSSIQLTGYPKYDVLIPFFLYASVDFLTMIFSIYTGIVLWRVKPKAILIAKLYLITILVASIYQSVLPIIIGYSIPPEVEHEIFMNIFFATVYVIVWFLYIKKSMRVCAIYGKV